MVPGARLREVCAWVEDEILRRGGEIAFPVQTSCNDVAAHYCPTDDEATLYEVGDVAKLDIGVHVDGWVVDTAVTVNVGDTPANRPLVAAARAALQAALGVAGPRVAVRTLSAAIEKAVASHGLHGLRNLCGHGVGRWTVHGPPAIPNVPMDQADVLQPGSAVAIEPFVTDGSGVVSERGVAEVFRFDPRHADVPGLDPALLDTLRGFRGLPFARHQVVGFAADEVSRSLDSLRRVRALVGYPPLVETSGHRVAQAEHTIYVGEDGVEVLTR
jgi:methionyl aminopeptidase